MIAVQPVATIAAVVLVIALGRVFLYRPTVTAAVGFACGLNVLHAALGVAGDGVDVPAQAPVRDEATARSWAGATGPQTCRRRGER